MTMTHYPFSFVARQNKEMLFLINVKVMEIISPHVPEIPLRVTKTHSCHKNPLVEVSRPVQQFGRTLWLDFIFL